MQIISRCGVQIHTFTKIPTKPCDQTQKRSERTHPCGFLNSTHARLPHQTRLLVLIRSARNIYSKYTTFPVPNSGVKPKSVRVNSSQTNVFPQQFHILLLFLSRSFSSSGEIKKITPLLLWPWRLGEQDQRCPDAPTSISVTLARMNRQHGPPEFGSEPNRSAPEPRLSPNASLVGSEV